MENKPRIIAYMPLHYGADYLKESLQSVINHVDKIVILYTEKPSHGHGTNAICPESELYLLDIALEACGDKLIWHKGSWPNEGAQRGHIYNSTAGYDIVLALDADEVFKTEELDAAIEKVYNGNARYYGIAGYVNLWRSFSFACYDGFTPIRFTNLHRESGEGVIPLTIYHFSCAQSKMIMDYKYLIHGHADEIRPNWLQEKYYAWTPENNFTDLHPTSISLWNATPFDKETLPESLKKHPNFNKKIIE